MLGDFLYAWLDNIFQVIVFSLSSFYCLLFPLVFLFEVFKNSSKPEQMLRTTSTPTQQLGKTTSVFAYIPGRYVLIILLLVVLWIGASRASIPKEPSDGSEEAMRPKPTPLQDCINGYIPDEFREEDKKMLRLLRFEWTESKADGEALHGKLVRKLDFLEMERQITPEEAASHLSSSVKQSEVLSVWWEGQWKIACRTSAAHLKSFSPPRADPDKP